MNRIVHGQQPLNKLGGLSFQFSFGRVSPKDALAGTEDDWRVDEPPVQQGFAELDIAYSIVYMP